MAENEKSNKNNNGNNGKQPEPSLQLSQQQISSESITYKERERYKSAMDGHPIHSHSFFPRSVSLIQVKHIRDRFENELVDFCKCFGINNAVRSVKLNWTCRWIWTPGGMADGRLQPNEFNVLFVFSVFPKIYTLTKLMRSEADIKRAFLYLCVKLFGQR